MKGRGFMNYKKKQLVPDLTPLIDVVFLLLIFFMVATTFDKNSYLKIDLPVASSETKLNENIDKLSVVINSTKELKLQIEINKKSETIDITKEELKNKLSEKLLTSKSKRVTIFGDKGVEYGFIVEVMSDIKSSGAEGVDIEIKNK